MRKWLVSVEYLKGDIFAYEFHDRENAEDCMTAYPSIIRRVTLMKRTNEIPGCWETVYYIDKEGRHDL